MDVVALEYSEGCVEVMRSSGVENVIHQDYRKHDGKYDTILILMNGLGMAGTLKFVPEFLKKCYSMLNEGGQIFVDSSDITYLYKDGLPKPTGYYGELRYAYEYKNQKGDWFDWVYVDQQTLTTLVNNLGYEIEIMMTDEYDQYLARIF
jgi:hypothetical protein